MGYRASVVEFVDPEATARNVLIRAARVTRPGTGTALADYADLREAWGVTPFLARRLAALRPELAPAEAGGDGRAESRKISLHSDSRSAILPPRSHR